MPTALAHSGPMRVVAAADIIVGMPQLCRAGLSETWLWKECGHRHWLALAALYGMEQPDFRDANGERLYPAFTDVSLANGRLASVGENDRLYFTVTLSRISRTRFLSRIVVSGDAGPVAEIAMASIFLRRRIPSRNRSVERGFVRQHCAAQIDGADDPTMRALRTGQWREHLGFRQEDRRTLADHRCQPSPHEDFNGAEFLYFASFQALLDRAEWAWFGQATPLFTTIRRDIVFAGNIELGDALVIRLCGRQDQGDRVFHWAEYIRESDGARIGEAMTVRAAC